MTEETKPRRRRRRKRRPQGGEGAPEQQVQDSGQSGGGDGAGRSRRRRRRARKPATGPAAPSPAIGADVPVPTTAEGVLWIKPDGTGVLVSVGNNYVTRPGEPIVPRNLIEKNLISGNMDAGIFLINGMAVGNRIMGNKIGTDLAGVASISNYLEGIYLERAATNTIGGPLPGMGILISGNRTRGIFLTNASGNVIQGNWIGVKSDGLTTLGNRFFGVECPVRLCRWYAVGTARGFS